MNKLYATYINESNMNSIHGIRNIVDGEPHYGIETEPVLSKIEIQNEDNITIVDYYVLDDKLEKRVLLDTVIQPSVSGTTTVRGDNLDTVIVTEIPLNATVNVWQGRCINGQCGGVVFMFEEVDDGEFITSFDLPGDYTIEVIAKEPQYKNTPHYINVI